MEYSNFFSETVDRIRYVYFAAGATAVFMLVKNIGSKIVSEDFRQELREYEDSYVPGGSLCINVIGKNEMIVRVSSDDHLLVWRVRKCS